VNSGLPCCRTASDGRALDYGRLPPSPSWGIYPPKHTRLPLLLLILINVLQEFQLCGQLIDSPLLRFYFLLQSGIGLARDGDLWDIFWYRARWARHASPADRDPGHHAGTHPGNWSIHALFPPKYSSTHVLFSFNDFRLSSPQRGEDSAGKSDE